VELGRLTLPQVRACLEQERLAAALTLYQRAFLHSRVPQAQVRLQPDWGRLGLLAQLPQ